MRTAASSVVQAVKSAVIANTTTSMMYGGLTVLLFPEAQVFKRGFQTYSSVEARLQFFRRRELVPPDAERQPLRVHGHLDAHNGQPSGTSPST